VEDVRILVVWGLGGAGKSQLVLNYIREYRRDYAAVFWIEAGSKESIERDYVQIYRRLFGHQMNTGHEMVKVDDAVPAVKRWFHDCEGRWLVVLDSADAIDNDRDKAYIDLGYFMPDAPGVHVIITSRSSTAREMTALDAVEVAEMETSEATELFLRYAKLTEERPDVTKEVDEIVGELGYLALAITLAGSYVSVTARLSSDIRMYLPQYRQRRKELLRRRAKRHIHQYGESVLSTWEASFEAIENDNPAAARLLSLLAFVNFEDIFLGLFDGGSAGTLASAPTRIADPSGATSSSDKMWWTFLFCGQKWTAHDLESAFETLQNYSLIQRKSDQGSYVMHKLVHAWGQDRLETDRQRQLSSLALELMANATAKNQIDPSHQLRLVPHVMASFGTFSPLHESLDDLAMDQFIMIDGIGDFLSRIGRWSEAYEFRVFHLRKIGKMLGKEHPDTLGSMNDLAVVLHKQGKFDKAEKMHRQVLMVRETTQGKNHPDTLTSMNNLAVVLHRQGKYDMAEKMQRQVLMVRETTQGKNHPDTLTSMNNLALVLSEQDKFEEAEKINRQALALSETVLGKKHPDRLSSMNNLASVLNERGKYDEAEKMDRQVLMLREAMLGKEHPMTLISMNNLAIVLTKQDKYNEAEEISRQALASSEIVLGKEHPDTLLSVHGLAYLLHLKKQYKDADVLYNRANTRYRKTLGEKHRLTVACSRDYSLMLEEAKGR